MCLRPGLGVTAGLVPPQKHTPRVPGLRDNDRILGGLPPQKGAVSVWRPEVSDQGVAGPSSLPRLQWRVLPASSSCRGPRCSGLLAASPCPPPPPTPPRGLLPCVFIVTRCSPLCVSVSKFPRLTQQQSPGQAPLIQSELNLITYTKSLFLNKVTFTGTGRGRSGH